MKEPLKYSERSATGKGWDDAKAGLHNRNPYHPKHVLFEFYDKGYNDWHIAEARAKKK